MGLLAEGGPDSRTLSAMVHTAGPPERIKVRTGVRVFPHRYGSLSGAPHRCSGDPPPRWRRTALFRVLRVLREEEQEEVVRWPSTTSCGFLCFVPRAAVLLLRHGRRGKQRRGWGGVWSRSSCCSSCSSSSSCWERQARNKSGKQRSTTLVATFGGASSHATVNSSSVACSFSFLLRSCTSSKELRRGSNTFM